MAGGVTILDLATQLGLSKTTVADALAGSGRVSSATRERVRAAVDRSGYVPNRAARALRGGSTATLGLYFPPAGRSLAFYMDFTFGAAGAAAKHDQDLTILTSAHNKNRLPDLDGVIVVDALPGDELIGQLLSTGIPMVTAGRLPQADATTAAVIEVDHVRMATAMFSHLEASGASQIILVAPDKDFDSSWSRDIQAAYRAWCRQTKTQFCLRTMTVLPEQDALTELFTRTLIPRLHAELPVALVFAAQSLAGRMLPLLTSNGLRIGSDVLVGGLVGDPTEISNPLLTTIDLRARKFGHSAVDLLLRLRNGTAPPGVRIEHSADLIPARIL